MLTSSPDGILGSSVSQISRLSTGVLVMALRPLHCNLWLVFTSRMNVSAQFYGIHVFGCIWYYRNTLNEIYLYIPHISNMSTAYHKIICFLHASPRGPLLELGAADVGWLPPSCSFQSLQSSVPGIGSAGVGSGFIQGNLDLSQISSPW